jgi:hypothetical protein
VAQHFLKLAGYQVYIPQMREQRLRRSRRVEVIAPLFPAMASLRSSGNGTALAGASALPRSSSTATTRRAFRIWSSPIFERVRFAALSSCRRRRA